MGGEYGRRAWAVIVMADEPTQVGLLAGQQFLDPFALPAQKSQAKPFGLI